MSTKGFIFIYRTCFCHKISYSQRKTFWVGKKFLSQKKGKNHRNTVKNISFRKTVSITETSCVLVLSRDTQLCQQRQFCHRIKDSVAEFFSGTDKRFCQKKEDKEKKKLMRP